MTPEETLDWLAQQHFDQCREERPIQDWIRKMKSQLPKQEQGEPVAYSDANGKVIWLKGIHKKANLYTTPQQRKPLTDEQYLEIGQRHWISSNKVAQIHKEIDKAAHGIKE